MAQGRVSKSSRSIAELTEEAANFDFYVERPLKSWLQSARVLLSQAASCEKDGDLQLAYLYTYRHAVLVLEKLPRYPAAERAKHKIEIFQATQQVKKNLDKLEIWKTPIANAHKQQAEALQAYKAAIAQRQSQQSHAEDSTSAGLDDGDDDFYYVQRRSLDADEHRELASQLSQRELQRRLHGTGTSLSQQSLRSRNDLTKTMQDTRSLLDHRTPSLSSGPSDRPASKLNYPSVPHRGSTADRATQPSSSPPLVPSKVIDTAPVRPDKESATNLDVKFKIKAYTEGGEGLRPVMLPTSLQQSFLNLVHPNTVRNLETCGVLCASLVSNALIITHLVIPDQTSTSDTCDTTEAGDNALFDYCDQQNLIACGWIHTHPSQSCFLSSRDLHTSSGYQQMLPEAIAIVCAPRHNPSLGIFRLTSPPGLPAVLKCQKPGTFHTHEEQNLYTDATTPGHVVEGSDLQFKVVDLRSG